MTSVASIYCDETTDQQMIVRFGDPRNSDDDNCFWKFIRTLVAFLRLTPEQRDYILSLSLEQRAFLSMTPEQRDCILDLPLDHLPAPVNEISQQPNDSLKNQELQQPDVVAPSATVNVQVLEMNQSLEGGRGESGGQ